MVDQWSTSVGSQLRIEPGKGNFSCAGVDGGFGEPDTATRKYIIRRMMNQGKKLDSLCEKSHFL